MLNIQCGGSFMEWNKSSQCRSCVCTPAFSKNESQGGGRIGRPFLHTEVKGDGMGMSNQTEEKELFHDNLTHTRGKGIEFSHGSITAPYAKVTLKWPEAAKRIGELISQNKFLSDADWAAMPEYERKQLARKIVNFFMDTPDDVVRPFSQNAITDYWECVKAVTVQLSDADRVQEIYQNMPHNTGVAL